MIAGDGVLRDAMIERARARGVRCHFLGFCNQSRMPGVLPRAMLCFPSDAHETWGLVANEALASGRPVILSEGCGAAPDLAGDGKARSRLPVQDIRALATAIRDVFERPPSSEDIRERSERHSLRAAARSACWRLWHSAESASDERTGTGNKPHFGHEGEGITLPPGLILSAMLRPPGARTRAELNWRCWRSACS